MSNAGQIGAFQIAPTGMNMPERERRKIDI